jgi:hypothetical protein
MMKPGVLSRSTGTGVLAVATLGTAAVRSPTGQPQSRRRWRPALAKTGAHGKDRDLDLFAAGSRLL